MVTSLALTAVVQSNPPGSLPSEDLKPEAPRALPRTHMRYLARTRATSHAHALPRTHTCYLARTRATSHAHVLPRTHTRSPCTLKRTTKANTSTEGFQND